jgi:hypothetical protein
MFLINTDKPRWVVYNIQTLSQLTRLRDMAELL